MITLQIQCDGEDCCEESPIDVALDRDIIFLNKTKEYMADCLGWSFGEYEDEGRNKQVLCKRCTEKRESV